MDCSPLEVYNGRLCIASWFFDKFKRIGVTFWAISFCCRQLTFSRHCQMSWWWTWTITVLLIFHSFVFAIYLVRCIVSLKTFDLFFCSTKEQTAWTESLWCLKSNSMKNEKGSQLTLWNSLKTSRQKSAASCLSRNNTNNKTRVTGDTSLSRETVSLG